MKNSLNNGENDPIKFFWLSVLEKEKLLEGGKK